jgi:hypothetical protein
MCAQRFFSKGKITLAIQAGTGSARATYGQRQLFMLERRDAVVRHHLAASHIDRGMTTHLPLQADVVMQKHE